MVRNSTRRHRSVLLSVWLGAVVSIVACRSSRLSQPKESSDAARERVAREHCSLDLQATLSIVPKVYAGYQDKLRFLGEEALERATRVAQDALPTVRSETDCDALLSRWLDTFQDGHVTLHSPHAKANGPPSAPRPAKQPPSFTRVETHAAVLKIPSFNGRFRRQLDALLTQHAQDVNTRDLLVLDLRGNGGGSDSTYSSLVPLLYTGPIQAVGVDALASPETADAWLKLLEEIPPTELETRRTLQALAEKIRAAPPGSFISTAEDAVITLPETKSHPRRVAVFVDRGCASSCEQFVLLARQSRKVTLFGTATGGVLDYANVRRFFLPSPAGRRLGLATTRSRRLPAEPVDGRGIAPHVTLDEAILQEMDAAALVRAAEAEQAAH